MSEASLRANVPSCLLRAANCVLRRIVAGVLAFAMGGVFKRTAVIKEENDEIF
ncbi:MAG: hypothetical protein MSA52_09415 [Oscillospiraceae bacterium]|nr:hypothetical protein [Oscillospiraceae bacterium]